MINGVIDNIFVLFTLILTKLQLIYISLGLYSKYGFEISEKTYEIIKKKKNYNRFSFIRALFSTLAK